MRVNYELLVIIKTYFGKAEVALYDKFKLALCIMLIHGRQLIYLV